MNVKEIVEKHLKENGFDGLFCPGECACMLEDLFCCGSDQCSECEPGYYRDDVTPEFEFTIGLKKTADGTDETDTTDGTDKTDRGNKS